MAASPLRISVTYCFIFVVLSFTHAQLLHGNDSCGCSRQFHPLCGTNGVTYDNECLLRCGKRNVDIAYKGVCCPENNCPVHTDYICDTGGTTHLNECLFELNKCLRKRIAGANIFVDHRGSCSDPEDCRYDCSRDVTGPVCDSAERTHNNFCEFMRFNCEVKKEGKLSAALLDHFGVCRKEEVESIADPIRIPDEELNELKKELEISESLDSDNATTVIEEGDVEAGKKINITVAENSDNAKRLQGVPVTKIWPGIYEEGENDEVVSLLNGEEENRTGSTTKKDILDAMQEKRKVAKDPLLVVHSEKTVQIDEAQYNETSLSQPRVIISEFAFAMDEEPLSVEGSGEILEIEEVMPTEVTVLPCSAAACDKKWDPVCDSRNVTHRNRCLFEFHACSLQRKRVISIGLAHEGECGVRSLCSFCDGSQEESVPACDNNNRTHDSLCELAEWNCGSRKKGNAEAVLLHLGRCHSRSLGFTLEDEDCPIKCSRDYKPVCDYSGRTHANLCAYQKFNCLSRKSDEQWSAEDLKSLFACSDDFIDEEFASTPVISDDGGTATSFSIDEARHLSRHNKILCPKPDCPHQGLPVCDNHGGVHENACAFNYARCLAAQEGTVLTLLPEDQCALSGCSLKCEDQVPDPICGSDFRTYSNICQYRKARCENPALEQLFKGSCSLCFDRPCADVPMTAEDYEFICDHNSVTRSRCEYKMLKCVLERNFGYNLKLLHEGKCCPSTKDCPKTKDSVCGSDGRTYPNNCTLQATACRVQKEFGQDLSRASDGKCAIEARLEDKVVEASTEASEELDDRGMTDGLETESHSTRSIKNYPDLKAISSDTTPTCTTNCSSDGEPICASNGKTYASACDMKNASCKEGTKLTVIYKGSCCMAECSHSFSPVCDSDGRTHRNLCLFGIHRCESLKKEGTSPTIASFDLCLKEAVSPCKKCASSYKPVCGENGETYNSECDLARANCLVEHGILADKMVQKNYDGECCPAASHCNTDIFSPVCDSDGKTHSNECYFAHHKCVEKRKNGRKLEMAYKGACCNQPCAGEFDPVCDGENTHSSLCDFKVAECLAERRGTALTIAYTGQCCSLEKGKCHRSGAVCDSDGETHSDRCRFDQKKCILSRNNLKNISIVHSGECCVIEKCGKNGQEVCDTKGGTHASLCHLKNTKCINDKIHPESTIEYDYDGPCCPSECASEWSPVCDQHGNAYKNACFFRQRACETSRRTGTNLLQTPCPTRRTRHLIGDSTERSS